MSVSQLPELRAPQVSDPERTDDRITGDGDAIDYSRTGPVQRAFGADGSACGGCPRANSRRPSQSGGGLDHRQGHPLDDYPDHSRNG
jgi:hypothetical protein